MEAGEGRCPECGNALRTSDPRFVRWCERCDWGLDPSNPPVKAGIVARYRRRLEERLVTALFEELRGQRDPKPGRDLAATCALALAIGIHLFTLAMLVLGVWILVALWRSPFAWLAGLGLIGVAIAMRPRVAKLEPDVRWVTREEAPRLYALVDRICDELNGPRLDIVVSLRFNASAGRYGLTQRPILELGLPLWNLLGPQERADLVGHEVGHFVNHDPTRGLVLGTAWSATSELSDLLTPNVTWGDDLALFSTISRGIMRGLALIPHGLAIALALLSLRAKQRAEYLADQLGSRVGSSQASVRGLEISLLGRASMNALETAVRRRKTRDDLWRIQREHLASVPPLEWERLRRVAAKRAMRIDETHPPTHLRIELVKSRPQLAAAVIVGSTESELIDKELAPVYGEVAKELHQQLLRDLYY